jgi:hypothetical protein
MDDARLRILKMIDEGQISAADGLRLIGALRQAPPGPEAAASAPAEGEAPPAAPTADRDDRPMPPRWARWQGWWLIPMWAGVAVTLAGALLMYWAYMAAFTFSGWFWLALLLVFAPGVAIMALAAASRNIKWLHLRIRNERSHEKLRLSLPIPIAPAAWFLRTFGHQLPALKDTGVDELILALGETTSPENPLYVEVDDDEEGEKVQVYLG